MLTEAQVALRLPVWHALSDLFLDTELQETDYAHIAHVLRGSGYEAEELRRILADEVTPAFATNLMSVAGEWAGWSPDEVRGIVCASLRSARLFPPLAWLKTRLFRAHSREEWTRINRYLRS